MFKHRSTLCELLDQEHIPKRDLFQNLKELDFINQWLGGYQVTYAALKGILVKGKTYTLVDIGCGGGDTVKRISRWSKRQGYELELAGIDLKMDCIDYAKTEQIDQNILFYCDDYRNMFHYFDKVDIIHASLFCHHFSNQDLVKLIELALKEHCVLIINDLERNPLAYYAIKFLTFLFSKSYLVKNDAPLSVLRGFKKKEWQAMVQQAGAAHYTIKNKWAFRHEIIIYGNREPEV